mmetsp:Transcript_96974/g.141857  ORF Transcript_96974/g.141857 Transcript_96974/m.141857 type:complete len:227 (+) Transcript_96974:298-978(+)
MGSSDTLVGSKLEVLLDNIGVALLQPSPAYPLPVTHESRLNRIILFFAIRCGLFGIFLRFREGNQRVTLSADFGALIKPPLCFGLGELSFLVNFAIVPAHLRLCFVVVQFFHRRRHPKSLDILLLPGIFSDVGLYRSTINQLSAHSSMKLRYFLAYFGYLSLHRCLVDFVAVMILSIALHIDPSCHADPANSQGDPGLDMCSTEHGPHAAAGIHVKRCCSGHQGCA